MFHVVSFEGCPTCDSLELWLALAPVPFYILGEMNFKPLGHSFGILHCCRRCRIGPHLGVSLAPSRKRFRLIDAFILGLVRFSEVPGGSSTRKVASNTVEMMDGRPRLQDQEEPGALDCTEAFCRDWWTEWISAAQFFVDSRPL